MRLAELLTELEQRGTKLSDLMLRCHDNPNMNTVHDLRVSIRRYLSAIEVISLLVKESIFPKSFRKALKRLLDSYDELRDLDVLISDLSAVADIFTDQSLFLLALRANEKQLREHGVTQITNTQIADINTRIIKTQKRVTKKIRHISSKKVFKTIDAVYQECLRLTLSIEKTDPDTIHRLRIAFKKFRYVMEFFSTNLEDHPSGMFVKMRSFQTTLGSVQDASVLIDRMDHFEKKVPGAVRPEERLFAVNRLETRINAFLVKLPNLNTFWRKDKDHQHPWSNQPSTEDLREFIARMTQGRS